MILFSISVTFYDISIKILKIAICYSFGLECKMREEVNKIIGVKQDY
jgi:hypothetical protein